MPEEITQPDKKSMSRNAAKSNSLCDPADKGTIQTSPPCSMGRDIFSFTPDKGAGRLIQSESHPSDSVGDLRAHCIQHQYCSSSLPQLCLFKSCQKALDGFKKKLLGKFQKTGGHSGSSITEEDEWFRLSGLGLGLYHRNV